MAELDMAKLRELSLEFGYWPATTDPDDIERHRQNNERFDRMNAHNPFHSPCPVCGQPTRFKQFGPIPCACNQRVAEHEARKR